MRKTLLQTILAAFCAILAAVVEGGGVMLPGAQMLFGSGGAVKEVPDGDNTLAVVNNDTSTVIATDFKLGDKMCLELCYRQPTNVAGTGDVIVGFTPDQVSGDNADARDFRIFILPWGTSEIDLDCGHAANKPNDPGSGSRGTKVVQRGAWHVVKGPVAGSAYVDGALLTGNDAHYHADGNYGADKNPMYIFGYRANKSQRCAIRYVKVTNVKNGATLCSLWPDTRGGFVDMATGKLYTPQSGSVSVVKWETIT